MTHDQKLRTGLSVLPTPEAVHSPQGGLAERGITRERVGAQALCLSRLVIPPLTVERPHLHEDHETAIYILSGEVEIHHGPALDQITIARPGDYVYIPASEPHYPVNRSATEPCVALAARTDPHDVESLVLLDEQ